MTQIPNCPNCQSEYAYEDRGLFVLNAETNGKSNKRRKKHPYIKMPTAIF